jgi:hypothetical protein
MRTHPTPAKEALGARRRPSTGTDDEESGGALDSDLARLPRRMKNAVWWILVDSPPETSTTPIGRPLSLPGRHGEAIARAKGL